MTCIDKLREIHPEWTEEEITEYTKHRCPITQHIMHRPIFCGGYIWEKSDKHTCERCWERELYPENMNMYSTNFRLTGEDMRRLDRLSKRVNKSTDEVIYAALKIYEDGLDAVDASMKRGSYMSMIFELKE